MSKKKNKIQVVEETKEAVEMTGEEVKEEKKSKISIKKVAAIAGGTVVGIATIVGGVLLHKARKKEFDDYLESCGNAGTEIEDEETTATDEESAADEG